MYKLSAGKFVERHKSLTPMNWKENYRRGQAELHVYHLEWMDCCHRECRRAGIFVVHLVETLIQPWNVI